MKLLFFFFKKLRGLYRYFIKKPTWIIFYLLAAKSNRNIFPFLFNFLSFFYKSNTKVSLGKDNCYYINKNEWRFFYNRGIANYAKGLKNQKKSLREVYLLNQIKINEEDVIIDVGAHNGDFYLCFENKIQYYAIEPSPISYSNLVYNVRDQVLLNYGAWKSNDEKIDFFLKEKSSDSSIIK
jgi:hypothetical protein